MAANIAKMHAALKKKKAEEKERHESRVEAGRASIQRRWSAPEAPARPPLLPALGFDVFLLHLHNFVFFAFCDIKG